jgi:UDP-N-acetylmuramate dehydrogenase
MSDAGTFGKVAVLMGGPSSEREISLLSGNAVLAALVRSGIDAHPFDPAVRDLWELRREGFARAFIALHGCGEAEFLAGIPGTVGGALAMNAGCYGGETWRYVARVEVLMRDGTFAMRTPADYAVGYRSVTERDGSAPRGIFTAAWFRFPPGDAQAARARIKALLGQRIATQPLAQPNAGSVFRNPPGDHAARLIEACGLKGHAIGGAQVSEKHANFIVNPARAARAADIEALIVHVRDVVRERTGVDLEPEVRIVGEAEGAGAR